MSCKKVRVYVPYAAIDASPLAIRVCKKRGVKKAKVLRFEDVGKPHGPVFDTVILFGNNFGLFHSFKMAKQLLKMLYQKTSPQAVIIAETRDPYQTHDSAHRAYHHLNHARGRMGGQIRMRVRFQTYTSDWFDYLMVSKTELADILTGTGWRVKKFIDEPKGEMYVMILEKK